MVSGGTTSTVVLRSSTRPPLQVGMSKSWGSWAIKPRFIWCVLWCSRCRRVGIGYWRQQCRRTCLTIWSISWRPWICLLGFRRTWSITHSMWFLPRSILHSNLTFLNSNAAIDGILWNEWNHVCLLFSPVKSILNTHGFTDVGWQWPLSRSFHLHSSRVISCVILLSPVSSCSC